nr:MAG TPA: hypothetical protein [Caudoviricetes sp.]
MKGEQQFQNFNLTQFFKTVYFFRTSKRLTIKLPYRGYFLHLP